jgi:hypothetical protein
MNAPCWLTRAIKAERLHKGKGLFLVAPVPKPTHPARAVTRRVRLTREKTPVKLSVPLFSAKFFGVQKVVSVHKRHHRHRKSENQPNQQTKSAANFSPHN